MGKVTVLNIVLLSLISLCKASETACKRPAPELCTSHTKCAPNACLGKEGKKKFCRKCTCKETSQCRLSKDGKQVCECSPGFTGDNCECKIGSTVIENDPCVINPCENGKCSKGETGYTCACPTGYTGYCLRVTNINNLAIGYKTVTASSFGWNGFPEKAVDGNNNTDYNQNACFHSDANDVNPFWKVELKAEYLIKRIVITNRLDCCSERLKDLTIYVDDDVCANYEGPAEDIETVEIVCSKDGIYGSTVKIQMHNSLYLTLCEVQVFAWI